MSGTKNHLYGKPSLHKEELLYEMLRQQCRGKTKRVVQSSVHKPTQKCTQLNGIDPVHGTKCGMRVCHHHQTWFIVCHMYCT